jgi:hypothetical protein
MTTGRRALASFVDDRTSEIKFRAGLSSASIGGAVTSGWDGSLLAFTNDSSLMWPQTVPFSEKMFATALTSPNFTFTQWASGTACSTNPTCMFDGSSSRTLTGFFAQRPSLQIGIDITTVDGAPPVDPWGHASIEVLSADGRTHLGECAAALCELFHFDANQQILLRAHPSLTPGWQWGFQGWSGDASGTGDVAFTMTTHKRVTAKFRGGRIRVRIDPQPFLGLVVAGLPNNGHADLFICSETDPPPGHCVGFVDQDTEVELIAVPRPGFVFFGWRGGPAEVFCGSNPRCSLAINEPATTSAVFTCPGGGCTP